MAGFFDYLGRVFTEKGSWYKILTICALQGMSILFNPKAIMNDVSAGSMPEFNVPAILLYFLSAMLIFGFAIQIYNGFMNDKTKLLPDIDFMDMFVKSVRLVPFGLVWAIYLFVICFVAGFTAAAVMTKSSPVLAGVGTVVMIVFVLFFVWMLVALMIIHSKSFSFKYVLNPFTMFRICPRIIGPVILLMLLYGVANIVLYGLLFGGAILLGVAGDGMSTSTMVAFGIFLLIWGYLYNLFAFAYNLRFADIVKTRLSDTEYLDSDYYALPSEDDEPDSDESVDY